MSDSWDAKWGKKLDALNAKTAEFQRFAAEQIGAYFFRRCIADAVISGKTVILKMNEKVTREDATHAAGFASFHLPDHSFAFQYGADAVVIHEAAPGLH